LGAHGDVCERSDTFGRDAVFVQDDDILPTLRERNASVFNRGIHMLELVDSAVDYCFERDDMRSDAALEVLRAQPDPARFDEERQALIVPCAFVICLRVPVRFLDRDGAVSNAGSEVRAHAQSLALRSGEHVSHEGFVEGTDGWVDVGVLICGDEEVLRAYVLLRQEADAGVFVGIDEDVRIESGLQSADGACLVTSENRVVAVGIVVRSKLALEVLDAVGVVAWQDRQVDSVENFCSPVWFSGKFSEKRENALISGGFVAVLAVLDPDAELCVILLTVGER
jgi:hypothetical protein